MIMIDTHVLHWLATKDVKLGRRARTVIEAAAPADTHISVVSFWEIGTLIRKNRLRPMIGGGLAGLRTRVEESGVKLLSLDPDVVFAADSLMDFHGDPADRFITGTAIEHHLTLITADTKILSWPGTLQRIDARL